MRIINQHLVCTYSLFSHARNAICLSPTDEQVSIVILLSTKNTTNLWSSYYIATNEKTKRNSANKDETKNIGRNGVLQQQVPKEMIIRGRPLKSLNFFRIYSFHFLFLSFPKHVPFCSPFLLFLLSIVTISLQYGRIRISCLSLPSSSSSLLSLLLSKIA